MSGVIGQKGFTIIESMVALLILAIGMLGVGTLLATSLMLDRVSTRERQAMDMAIDKLDYLKKLPRNDGTGDITLTDNKELVESGQDYAEFTDKDVYDLYGSYNHWLKEHPEEEETISQIDIRDRRVYVRRWTVSRFYWPNPSNGIDVDSKLLQIDIQVGWPYTDKKNCYEDDMSGCKRVIEITTLMRPLPPPTVKWY